MRVLILGSGGREHVLAWKIAQSPLLTELFIAPGNGGTGDVATNVNLNVMSFDEVGNWAVDHAVDMVIVGPENPLVAGIHDYFLNRNELKEISVIGPQMNAARLEGSKEFAKKFMLRHGIPTAGYRTFTRKNLSESTEYLGALRPPYVLKADGLAAGKGVVILNDLDAAISELHQMIQNSKFGKASATVVVEEFLEGIEMSVFAVSDGNSFVVLPAAKDYKRIGEGDTGLNTGGMGAISPVPFVDDGLMNRITKEIIKPTFEGLRNEGIVFQGVLFFGLINTKSGPKVIEYNVRFGDPEAEVVIPRIKSDLLEMFIAVSEGTLHEYRLEVDPATAATVIMVAGGYPEAYEKGKEITGSLKTDESLIFHAGTKKTDRRLLTNGGRVLAVTSFGESMRAALYKCYKTAGGIDYEDAAYRKDIGFDLEVFAL